MIPIMAGNEKTAGLYDYIDVLPSDSFTPKQITVSSGQTVEQFFDIKKRVAVCVNFTFFAYNNCNWFANAC